MPVLGLAGCHRQEIQHWNCSAGTSPGVPGDILGSYEELRWMEPHVSSPSPCNKNHEGTSFTSIEMFHTHTHAQQQLFFLRLRLFKAPTSEMKVKTKGNGNEMAMGMRWQTTSPGDETENAKEERKRGNTNTNTPSPDLPNPQKGQGKRKSRRMTGQTPTREGGGGRKRLTQPTRREPNLYTAARDRPKPDLAREHAWDRGPMGN